jgi:hypothetical protein
LLMMRVRRSFGLNSEGTLLGGPWVEDEARKGSISDGEANDARRS